RLSALAYLCQALLMVALLLAFARINPSLYWWAGTAFLTKAVLTPWLLLRFLRGIDDHELKPLIGLGPSVVIAALMMFGFFRFTHIQAGALTPAGVAQADVYRTNLAVASTIFALGLYAVLTRRDALKTVIGLCLLENAVHLSL